MVVAVTRAGKNPLELTTPVMAAAGTFGYGEVYRDAMKVDKLGAIVTHPITYEGWSPARGTRVVPLETGVLMHTGLPNPGLTKTVRKHQNLWVMLPVPIVVHLVATTEDHVRKGAARLDDEDGVNAIELGLNDDITWQDADRLVRAATSRTEKPVLVRLPLLDAYEIADAVTDAGADALVISAPPRGTARDPKSGALITGRVYGPMIKPIALHAVERIAQRIDEIPIIGAGGIHTPQDARDFIEVGATAVQVDSVTWINPGMLERIARDLGGNIVTRESGALSDEWHPGMGDTEREQRQRAKKNDDDSNQNSAQNPN